MEYVILVRMNNGAVLGIPESDRLTTFPNLDDAVAFSTEHPLCCQMPYQIVELDEL